MQVFEKLWRFYLIFHKFFLLFVSLFKFILFEKLFKLIANKEETRYFWPIRTLHIYMEKNCIPAKNSWRNDEARLAGSWFPALSVSSLRSWKTAAVDAGYSTDLQPRWPYRRCRSFWASETSTRRLFTAEIVYRPGEISDMQDPGGNSEGSPVSQRPESKADKVEFRRHMGPSQNDSKKMRENIFHYVG